MELTAWCPARLGILVRLELRVQLARRAPLDSACLASMESAGGTASSLVRLALPEMLEQLARKESRVLLVHPALK